MATNTSYPKKGSKEAIQGWSTWDLFNKFYYISSGELGQKRSKKHVSRKSSKSSKEKV